jgi:hypothetical protein
LSSISRSRIAGLDQAQTAPEPRNRSISLYLPHLAMEERLHGSQTLEYLGGAAWESGEIGLCILLQRCRRQHHIHARPLLIVRQGGAVALDRLREITDPMHGQTQVILVAQLIRRQGHGAVQVGILFLARRPHERPTEMRFGQGRR